MFWPFSRVLVLALRLPTSISPSDGSTMSPKLFLWGSEQVCRAGLPASSKKLVLPKTIWLPWQVIGSRGLTPKSEINPGGIEAGEVGRTAQNCDIQHLGSRPCFADN